MNLSYIWTFVFLILVNTVHAKRKLLATSLVACMENSQLTAKSFDVVFNPDDRSLHYRLDLEANISGYVMANIEVYAYGFKIITKQLDLCSIGWKQFCPLYPGDVEMEAIQYISKTYTDEIPGIAYQVPDIDAYAKLYVYDVNSDKPLACIQAFFSNGKTVTQTGVKWGTAVIAGIGLLVSSILSTFGNSNAASHIAANTMSLFLYFQSVAVVSMEHVDFVPPIAAAWSENLIWSMGLIRISFMQRIFRWYVKATGGVPTLFLTSTKVSVLVQRSLNNLKNLYRYKRSPDVLYGNKTTLIFRGIERLAYRAGIENSSIVCTGFTFFVLCGWVLTGFIIISRCIVELLIRAGFLKNSRFIDLRKNWKIILKGSLLRYIYIGFMQLTILSFWEFVIHDSPAVVVIAVLLLLSSLSLMSWAAYKVRKYAKTSIKLYKNPAAILYGNQKVLNKYGFFYTMFNASHYWWGYVIICYIFLKALIISFAQPSGRAQALIIFIIELGYLIGLIYSKPYLDRATNILNIAINVVILINSFLFLFFSNLFGQPLYVSSIMGWIFFILNSAFSLILLIVILVYVGLVIFSHNPDMRFKPAKDDRTSFQRNSAFISSINQSVANELLALGNTAKDHSENWEEGLYTQSQSIDDKIFSGSEYMDEKIDLQSDTNHVRFPIASKLKEKLSIGRSKSTLAVTGAEPSNGSSSDSNILQDEKFPDLYKNPESGFEYGQTILYSDINDITFDPKEPEIDLFGDDMRNISTTSSSHNSMA